MAVYAYAGEVDTSGVDQGTNYKLTRPRADQPAGYLPTVTTQAVSLIGTTTATGNGNITDLGVPDPTHYGVVYNEAGSPTISDPHTDEGSTSSTGAFTSDMTGLTPGTDYHLKAYATNSVGTFYGNEVTFSTSVVLFAQTGTYTEVDTTHAKLLGLINPGGHDTDVTFFYATNAYYTANSNTYDQSVVLGGPYTGTTNISVSTNLTSLTPGTIYHYQVMAHNGTDSDSYGNDATFTTATAVVMGGPTTLTYPNTATYSATGGYPSGSFSYNIGASTGCTINSGSGLLTIVNAGANDCNVYATMAATSHYKAVNSAAYPVTLVKGPVILHVTNSPVAYDGLTHSATVAGSVPGTPNTVLMDGLASQTNAHTYAVTAGFVPTDANNYVTLPAGTSAGNFVIGAVNPILKVSPTSATYTGVAQSTQVKAYALNGTTELSGTVTHVYYNGSLTPPTNAGSYAITADFSSADSNYNTVSGQAASPNFVINKAQQATLYVTGPNSVGWGSAVAITTAGGSGNGSMSYSAGGSTGCSVNSGTGVITVTNLANSCIVTATKGEGTNYLSKTSAPWTVTLTLGTPVLYVYNSPTSYTGDPIVADVRARANSNPGSAAVAGTYSNIRYDGQNYPPELPGSYHVIVNFTSSDPTHYVSIDDGDAGDLVINKLAQTITFTSTPVNPRFGGTYTPTAGSNSGLEVTITIDPSSADICDWLGTSDTLAFEGEGTCLLHANQPGNQIYSAAPQVDQSITVGQAFLTVTAIGVDKVYDGNTDATVTFTDNRLPGTVIDVTYASATFADPNVGTNKTVTVTGIALSGTDAANYILTNPATTTTANILVNIGPLIDNDEGIYYIADDVAYHLGEGGDVKRNFDTITVTFSKNVVNVPHSDGNYGKSVINPANYMLVNMGDNPSYQTTSCSTGLNSHNSAISIDRVTYSTGPSGTGPFVATLNLNGGNRLGTGTYRLIVCGTTSITDMLGVKLAGDGSHTGTDFIRNFTVLLPKPSNIPATGFAPNVITQLPIQPAEKAYEALGGLYLIIPKLGIVENIVGIPEVDGSWDVKWLDNNVGWLQGSAYPSWSGNSILTGHYFNSSGTAGPFRYLNQLWYGDQIIIRAWGTTYTYQVRSILQVDPSDVDTMMQHQDTPWLSLVTCRDYLADENFKYRLIVRAALVSTK